jgi:hypothetical protein
MTSLETAVVSIPETKSGQVLVLIEQPGEASKLVTVPEMASSGPAEALADKFKAAVSARVEETVCRRADRGIQGIGGSGGD